MLALKNKATSSLYLSEKQSLRRFLSLYAVMAIVVIGVLSILYYRAQVQLKLSDARAELNKYAYIQTKRLKVLHQFFPEQKRYPRDSRFLSAIYDIEYQKIFSLLDDEDIRFKEEIYFTKDRSHIRLVKRLDEYYLGAYYLIVDVEDDGTWYSALWQRILFFASIALGVMLLFGWYLAKLFVKPMRDSIHLLNRFIKDTTHELNTPLSAILANIEAMDTDVMVEKNRKKLNRIHIAARTVSHLYRDLTFLTLEQGYKEKIERFNLQTLIQDRIEYFRVLGESKQLTCHTDLDKLMVLADKRNITRLIDNLISNAIKYNKRGGKVQITLKGAHLSVCDTGIGIKKENQASIFERYMRFDTSVGGFGVGLDIVKSIADRYNIVITVQSEPGKFTCFELDFASIVQEDAA